MDTESHEAFLESIAVQYGPEMLREVEAEFRLGWEREKVEAQMEMQRRAEACSRLESAAIEGLGHIEMDIPAASYFYWLKRFQKEGVKNVWSQQEWRREYLRDNPGVRVKYRSAKPRTGWTPGQMVLTDKRGGVLPA